jgi:hypothetical protein
VAAWMHERSSAGMNRTLRTFSSLNPYFSSHAWHSLTQCSNLRPRLSERSNAPQYSLRHEPPTVTSVASQQRAPIGAHGAWRHACISQSCAWAARSGLVR